MRTRKPLIAAAVLSLLVTGPAVVSALSPSDEAHDQVKKGKDRNRQNNGNRNNGHGRNGGEDRTQMRFAGMDTNRDGRITRDEWRGNDVSFNQHDWNGDGVLSGIEVTPGATRPRQSNSLFRELDQNNDGRLSRSEWRGSLTQFDRLDRNDDGFLSLDEFSRHR